MKKIILFLAISLFLLGACSQQKAEDLIGQGTQVGDIRAGSGEQGTPNDQQIPGGDANVEKKIVPAGDVKEFKITAKQFAFEPGTIEVNKGDKVRLIVTSIDVPHGIKIAEYGINERLDVGKPVTIEFTADKEGTFTVFCSVFCGSGHGNMKGTLIVK